jgi:23S rRNA G2445 N2-methylase RlmL
MEELLLVTCPGLEAVTADEAAEVARGTVARPVGADAPGLVHAAGPAQLDWRGLRTAQRAARWCGQLPAATLDELRDAAAGLEVPCLEEARSFRVSAHAAPGAALAAREAAGAVGAALQARTGVRVDLTAFEVEVRLDLLPGRAVVSVPLHREALDRRVRRPWNVRSALKPSVAAALVRLAGAHRGPGALLDPTCGSGTIPVEAKQLNAELEVCASDWDQRSVECARGTVLGHGLDVAVRRGDARALPALWERRFDFVVLNPPFGHRVGRRARMDELLGAILSSVGEVLEPAGRIVVLTPRLKALARAAAAAGLAVRRELRIEMGGLRPVAHVLERPRGAPCRARAPGAA